MPISPSSRLSEMGTTIDRISELRDHLLCHILSFLPTNTTVSTCVLSQRWRYVWTGIPVLKLTYNPLNSINSQKYMSWKKCINQILLRNNNSRSLDRLDLDLLELRETDDFNEWFSNISSSSIKAINLLYKTRDCPCPRELPLMSFLTDAVSKQLVALRLTVEISSYYSSNCVFKVSSLLRLPKLKTLHLSEVCLTDEGEPLKSLLDGSPVLSELVIENCWCSNETVTFHSSSLKVLKIIEIRINAIIVVPNLEYLELEFYNEVYNHLILDMPSLKKAKLSHCWIPDRIWIDLLKQLSHVQSLYLNLADNYLEVNDPDYALLPDYLNLKCLEVKCTELLSYIQMEDLLKCMPNCVSLVLHLNGCTIDYGYTLFVPGNLGFRLKNFEIRNINWGRSTLEAVEDMLTHYRVLEEIRIYVSSWRGVESKNKIMKKLSELRRASRCNIRLLESIELL